MANFSTAQRVLNTIRAGDTVEYDRGVNRVKINNAANCAPPLDPLEANKNGLKINVNFGELMVLLAHARRQYMSAFWGQQDFFKITIPTAPKEVQSEWGAYLTTLLSSYLKKSLAYFELHRSKWAAVSCHGIGPQAWFRKDGWLPEYVAIEDLRIPTDTTLDFKNLDWFAVRKYYTVFELLNEAFGPKERAKNWDQKSVGRILKNYKETNWDFAPNSYDWETTPEKLAELVKQDGGYYSADALPSIPLYHFYFVDNTDKDNKGWFMRVVPETGALKSDGETKFLWTSETPVAPRRDQILQCQFGDLNNKAPFLYHSIRSLGFALMEPTFYSNLTRCRMLQHVHDNFNIWLRLSDPADKARAAVQEFGNLGVLKSGVSIVPQTERHQIDPELVETAMAQLKQLSQEASASYTQQTDTGTRKEQTAFETRVKLEQVNAMMGGLLMTAFIYENHSYREICRRFCLPKSKDEDILDFQKKARDFGIPSKFIDSKFWEVEPVTPLGMGNPTLAQAQAKELMDNRGAYGPEAQQEVLHEWTLVTTGDPRKAQRWAPISGKKGPTNGEMYSRSVFGTLMQGVPLDPPEEFSPIEQIEAMLPLLAGVIVTIEKRDNIGTQDEITGLTTVAGYIDKLMQRLMTDPMQKARVKGYADAMKNLMNQVKGLAQRGQEQRQKQNGNGMIDPTAIAKAQSLREMTAIKLRGKELADEQKMRLNERKHIHEQRRKDADTFASIEREDAKAAATNRLKSFEE